MANSKKHHFVPQFFLNNFTVAGKETIHVFDKKNNKSFSSSLINTGHENNFNTVEINGEKFNFEEAFTDLDGAMAPVMRKLITSTTRFRLYHGDLYILSLIVWVQLFRTKLARTTFEQLSNDILNWMTGNHFEVPLEGISEQQSKFISLSGFDDIEERMKLLLSKGIVLFKSPDSHPLWISDNPVVMFNELPYGRLGLETPGTDVYMPISKNYILGFLCRINCKKISEAYLKMQENKNGINNEIELFYNAIQNNTIINLTKDHVDFFNSLQVQYSSRFLYGPAKDFLIAEDILKEVPELKETKTSIAISHEKKSPKMPMGEFIVFYLENDHFMIPAKLLPSESHANLVFCTTKLLRLFDFFINKTEIACVEVYKDQVLIRLSREVYIAEFDVTRNKVTIRHIHEGLNEILTRMKSKRKSK